MTETAHHHNTNVASKKITEMINANHPSKVYSISRMLY
jgi:hypothetical protein